MTSRGHAGRIARGLWAGALATGLASTTQARLATEPAPPFSAAAIREPFGSAAYTRDSWIAAGLANHGSPGSATPSAPATKTAHDVARDAAGPGLHALLLAVFAAAVFVLRRRRSDH